MISFSEVISRTSRANTWANNSMAMDNFFSFSKIKTFPVLGSLTLVALDINLFSFLYKLDLVYSLRNVSVCLLLYLLHFCDLLNDGLLGANFNCLTILIATKCWFFVSWFMVVVVFVISSALSFISLFCLLLRYFNFFSSPCHSCILIGGCFVFDSFASFMFV